MSHAIAKCVLSCGTALFFEDFFNYMCGELAVDQCNIFLVTNSGDISCLVARNFLEEKMAIPLAESYLSGGYKEDPNIVLLDEMSVGQTTTVHLSEFMQKISSTYREQFFSTPSLVDKVAIITKGSTHSYYINLYRGSGKRLFRDDGLFLNRQKDNIISALTTKHYSLDSELISESPLAFLSERERQVCKGILSGKKAEAVAFDLDLSTSSIITYRRRAYQKLGINSRSALFALCKNF